MITVHSVDLIEGNMQSGKITVPTARHMELVDITRLISDLVKKSGVVSGNCFLFNPHTTAGLTINEGADPAVKEDIIAGMKEIVPIDYPFKHMEGNSPSHIMASLMGCSLTTLIEDNQLILGTWQKIFFCEFDGPRTRKLIWQITSNS
jgi:secondary thiamine-phosphate synthase enzyme